MKTKYTPTHSTRYLILVLFLTVSILVFILLGCNNTDSQIYNNKNIPTCLLPAVNTSTIIDLTPHELDVDTAKREIDLFIRTFSIKAAPSKTIGFQSTPVLKIEAMAFCNPDFQREWDSCRSSNTQTIIPALRFHHGYIEAEQKTTFIFQPICLKVVAANSTSITFSPISESKNYYEYDNSRFKISLNYSAYTEAYKKHILICNPYSCKNPQCKSTGHFIEKTHVTSLIYTLYEIGSLIKDNLGKTINLCNAAILDFSKCDSTVIRHSIILGPEGSEKLLGFNNKFANLSHLCPPSCNEFIFKRAAATPNQLITKQTQKPKSIWIIIMEVGELLIAILVGLLVFKSLHTGHRYLLYQTILALLVLLFCYYLTWYQKTHLLERNTHLVYNIAIPFEIGFIYMYINHFFKSNIIRTVLIISYVLFLILYAIESFTIGYNTLHNYSLIFAALCISALSIRMLYISFLSKANTILHNGTFWICFGLVLYFLVTIPYISLINFFIIKKVAYNKTLYFVIINLLALFRYIFLAIGFFIVYKNKKTDS